MSQPLVLDTSGWLKALAGDAGFAETLEDASLLYVPSLVLAEVDYHLRARRRDMWRLLHEVQQAPYVVEPVTLEDLSRAAEIDRKFREAELGLVDAVVVATAERLGVHRVLSADSDFTVVRFGPRWDLYLELPVVPERRRTSAQSHRGTKRRGN